MKSKKLLTLIIVGAIIASVLTACSTASTGGNEKVTQVVTEVVTDKQGEAVTKENGEVVTEVVTDKNGDAVTEVVSTTKKGDEKSTSESTKQNGTTASSSSTTKQGETTKPNSPAKPATTKPTTEAPVDGTLITLQKNMGASCKDSDVKISSGKVEIDKPGDYVFRQSTDDAWHGQIVIKLKNTEKATFRFENVHIENNTKNIIRVIDSSIDGGDRDFLEAEQPTDSSLENKIELVAENEQAPNVDFVFPTETSSSFATSANAITGVIYNESKLTFKGNGSATVQSKVNANNCICSTKSITVKNVGLNLKTAQNTNSSSFASSTGAAKGIFSYSKVIVESGFLTIKTNGDGIRCSRFYMQDGTAIIRSSACDGIDADNSIIISGGDITSIALEKYCFKVRRVNNTENFLIKDRVRAGKDDCFRINGGRVVGESKKITTLEKQFQSDKTDSKQASLTGKIIKKNAGTADAAGESKVPGIIKIGGWSSSNKCTKFLYSSSSVEKGKEYSASANGNSASVTWTANAGNAGVALIKNSTNT